MGRKKRQCPICQSTSWRKEPSSGLVVCSEGHVLQNYRNETQDAAEAGPHTVRKRDLKSNKKRKERFSKANPKLYHGHRAQYHYFQCQQAILRMQIKTLVEVWKLPGKEYEVLCRDLWSLHLCLLENLPFPEPLIDSEGLTQSTEDQLASSNTNKGSQASNPRTGETAQEDTVDRGSQNDDASSSSSSSGRDDTPLFSGTDEETSPPRLDPDPNLATLLREASEPVSIASPSSPPTGGLSGLKLGPRSKIPPEYAGPAANIAILVLACWSLRLPLIYMDFIRLIQSYTLLYLEPLRYLPSSLIEPLTTTSKQALSPHHPPSVVDLHALTSRLARLLQERYGIRTPEMNAAPVLWRAVREFGGPPTLYTMTKSAATALSLNLHLHHSLAPPVARGNRAAPSYHLGDNAPPELALATVVLVVYKLVYGLDERQRYPQVPNDPACCLPEGAALLQYLRNKLQSHHQSMSEILSPTSKRRIADLSEQELDLYLNFCEHALLPQVEPKPSDSGGFDTIASYFPLPDLKEPQPPPVLSPVLDINPLPSNPIAETANLTFSPAEAITVFNSHDILGSLPDDYELLLEVAANWVGVGKEDMSAMAERFERRLATWWTKLKKEGKATK